MTVVRKIVVVDMVGVPKFTFDSTGLPERPVIMHTCSNCQHDAVITNKDAGDLAAWLIGEAVDDAHGNGVIICTYSVAEDTGSPLRCALLAGHHGVGDQAGVHVTTEGTVFV